MRRKSASNSNRRTKTYCLQSGEKGGVKASLQFLINENAGKRVAIGREGKDCSFKTREERAITLFKCFDQLHELGFKLKDVHGFKLRHAIALGHKWEDEGKAPATIANRLSHLSVLCRWIKKPGMLNPIEKCVRNPASVRRSYIASEDKSWAAKGLNSELLIKQIGEFDPYVANQLFAMESFGLRRKEALLFTPTTCFDPVSRLIKLTRGTKGGRPRTILLDTDEKLAAIHRLIAAVDGSDSSLISPDYKRGESGLKRAARRFNYVMGCFGLTKAEAGVTSHGLRHQRFNDDFKSRTGVESPVRGGQPEDVLDKTVLNAERMRLAQEAGHSRIKITSAYLGAIKK